MRRSSRPWYFEKMALGIYAWLGVIGWLVAWNYGASFWRALRFGFFELPIICLGGFCLGLIILGYVEHVSRPKDPEA